MSEAKRVLVKQENGYKFWEFRYGPHTSYNITPETQPEPSSGYTDKGYIEGVKGQKFDQEEVTA